MAPATLRSRDGRPAVREGPGTQAAEPEASRAVRSAVLGSQPRGFASFSLVVAPLISASLGHALPFRGRMPGDGRSGFRFRVKAVALGVAISRQPERLPMATPCTAKGIAGSIHSPRLGPAHFLVTKGIDRMGWLGTSSR